MKKAKVILTWETLMIIANGSSIEKLRFVYEYKKAHCFANIVRKSLSMILSFEILLNVKISSKYK